MAGAAVRSRGAAVGPDLRRWRPHPGGRTGAGARAAAMPLQLELCPGRWVGGQHPCFIIAEIGQNHQGDLDVAKRMIRVAKVRGRAAGSGRREGRAPGGAAPRAAGTPLSPAPGSGPASPPASRARPFESASAFLSRPDASARLRSLPSLTCSPPRWRRGSLSF